MTRDRFAGCLLGLALGDALGAPYEGGPLERLVWHFIGETRQARIRWTDDTQMALDLAESLLETGGLDADRLARRFAASYRWSRGYGPGTKKLLKRITQGEHWRQANRAIYSNGSFGNGGAMRAPVIGLFYAEDPEELVKAARLSASVTHAHPLGIEGAVLIATAVAQALESRDGKDILERSAEVCGQRTYVDRFSQAISWARQRRMLDATEVVQELGNGIAANESCVTAVYIGSSFLESSFEEMMKFVIACGGDVDTIGAMAGAIWGAARGTTALPTERLDRLEDRERIERVAHALQGATAPILCHAHP